MYVIGITSRYAPGSTVSYKLQLHKSQDKKDLFKKIRASGGNETKI